MEDRTLIIIAFICAIIGIIALFIITQAMPTYRNNIYTAEEDEILKISGKIIKIEDKGSHSRLRIDQSTPIDAIIFEDEQLGRKNLVNHSFTFVGKKSSFNGKPELIISRID